MAQSFDDDKTISATEINQNLVRSLGSKIYKRCNAAECGAEFMLAVGS